MRYHGPAWIGFFSACAALACCCLPLLEVEPHSYSLYQILWECGLACSGLCLLAGLAAAVLCAFLGFRRLASLTGLAQLCLSLFYCGGLIRNAGAALILAHTTVWAWLYFASLAALSASFLLSRPDRALSCRLWAWWRDQECPK